MRGRKETTAQKLTAALVTPVKSTPYCTASASSKRATRALAKGMLHVISGGDELHLLHDLNETKTAVPVDDLVAVFEELATDDANDCCRHAMRRVLVKLLLRSRPRAKQQELIDLGMDSLSKGMFIDARAGVLVKRQPPKGAPFEK